MKKFQLMIGLLSASLFLISACNSATENIDTTQLKNANTDKSIVVPDTQMAIVQDGNGGSEVFKYQSIPVINPDEGQVLIKVIAAAINPIERRIREGGGGPPAGGMAGGMAAPAMGAPGGMAGGAPGGAGPSVPGGDLAGIVVKLGDDVSNVKIGDAVFAKVTFGAGGLNGSYSQYAVVPANQVVMKPTDHTFAEASGLATVGMTAMRTLDHAGLKAGDRVFINGVGGGIGSSAAQIAIAKGAIVLGTASGRHHEYLKSIGVSEVINYREVQFDEVITEPVDIVIETVSTETANQALNILKEGGHLVSIAGAANPDLCAEKGVVCARIGGNVGRSNSELMAELYQLAEAGKYRLNVDTTFPLEQAAAAQDQNFNVGTSGKVVLIVDAELANTK